MDRPHARRAAGIAVQPDRHLDRAGRACRIHEVVTRRGGITLIDEIYLGLSYDDAFGQPRSLGDDEIISINSFSKYFNMTGWRLGWLVVPRALVPAIERLAQNLFICATTLSQYAALACFEPATLAIYESRRLEFGRRRDFIVPALRSLGFEVPVVPDGGVLRLCRYAPRRASGRRRQQRVDAFHAA